MSDYYNAFEVSPVPAPGPEAVAPELFRGIYGMPMFVTVPSSNLTESLDFWVRGLGFFELFSVPEQLIHLRRWAFQDVLLVPSDAPLGQTATLSVSFACVLNQVESIAEACHHIRPGSVSAPKDTAWNTRDLEVLTPENVRLIFTAAKPHNPDSREAQNLAAIGITDPGSAADGHNEEHG